MNIKNVSIIFPVHNEVNTIEKVLTEWKNELKIYPNLKYEIIICEDGSNDGTSELLRKIMPKYKLILNQTKKRRGYGKAIQDGIKISKYDTILSIDSDGQYDPKDLDKYLNRFKNDSVLIGYRTTRKDLMFRKIYSKSFGILFKLLFKCNISDPSSSFVLFNKKLFNSHSKELDLLNEGYWWGFVGVCVKHRIPISQVKINHRIRFDGNTQVYKFSKIFGIAYRNGMGLIKLKLY